MSKKKRGRPSRLNDELAQAICGHIETTGCGLGCAAESEGVDERVAFRWLRWGRDGKEPYQGFSQDVGRARAIWEREALRKLEDIEAFVEDTRAASAAANAIKWKLERLRRQEYGAAITVKVEEAKEYLLDALERVCERMDSPEVLAEVLHELERGSQEAPSEAGVERIH